jgi:hypothetical protein
MAKQTRKKTSPDKTSGVGRKKINDKKSVIPAKFGRPNRIESPDQLMQWFEDYCADVASNPIKIYDWVGGMGKKVIRTKDRPLSIDGFEVYCFKQGYINDLGDYFSNKHDKYADFSTICRIIRQIVRSNQIEGGMAGIFNPSITQRLNGLVEKAQTDNTIKIQIDGTDDISV